VVGRDCRVATLLHFSGKYPDKSGDIREQVSIEIINKK